MLTLRRAVAILAMCLAIMAAPLTASAKVQPKDQANWTYYQTYSTCTLAVSFSGGGAQAIVHSASGTCYEVGYIGYNAAVTQKYGPVTKYNPQQGYFMSSHLSPSTAFVRVFLGIKHTGYWYTCYPTQACTLYSGPWTI